MIVLGVEETYHSQRQRRPQNVYVPLMVVNQSCTMPYRFAKQGQQLELCHTVASVASFYVSQLSTLPGRKDSLSLPLAALR